MVTMHLDHVSFTLLEPYNFSWLRRLGSVFCVYAGQDSGNLLFGVERDGMRRFVKYAGARTVDYSGTAAEAVDRLRQAAGVYRELRHPALIGMEETLELPQGFACVYDWFDGKGMHDLNEIDSGVDKDDPRSGYYRYRHLPLEKRLHSLRVLFDFLTYVEDRGFVAVDFYDGSVLYDFKNDITKICDIDLYRPKPLYNHMGPDFWGTKRLKAPEEYILGAEIDSRSNVFTLGALILHLFGAYTREDVGRMYRENAFHPCSREGWILDGPLYDVVRKATEPDKAARYPSMRAFREAFWTAVPKALYCPA